MKKELSHLLRELKTNEAKENKKHQKPNPASSDEVKPEFLLELFEILKSEWDEKAVMEVLEICAQKQRQELTRAVLDHIKAFKIFYTPSFTDYLAQRFSMH